MAGSPVVPKIKKESLTNRIYELFKGYIVSGEWPVGYRIPPELELAEQLGVSRPSVRTAIQRLSALGLLDVRVGEGTFVSEFSLDKYLAELGELAFQPKNLSEIADFRKVFELGAMKLAMERCSKAQLLTMEGLLNNLLDAADSGDEKQFFDADYAFHRYFCTMTGNSLLEVMYDIFASQALKSFEVNHSSSHLTPGFNREQEDHYILFKYFKEKNYEMCAKTYTEMIDYSVEDGQNG